MGRLGECNHPPTTTNILLSGLPLGPDYLPAHQIQLQLVTQARVEEALLIIPVSHGSDHLPDHCNNSTTCSCCFKICHSRHDLQNKSDGYKSGLIETPLPWVYNHFVQVQNGTVNAPGTIYGRIGKNNYNRRHEWVKLYVFWTGNVGI